MLCHKTAYSQNQDMSIWEKKHVGFEHWRESEKLSVRALHDSVENEFGVKLQRL